MQERIESEAINWLLGRMTEITDYCTSKYHVKQGNYYNKETLADYASDFVSNRFGRVALTFLIVGDINFVAFGDVGYDPFIMGLARESRLKIGNLCIGVFYNDSLRTPVKMKSAEVFKSGTDLCKELFESKCIPKFRYEVHRGNSLLYICYGNNNIVVKKYFESYGGTVKFTLKIPPKQGSTNSSKYTVLSPEGDTLEFVVKRSLIDKGER